MTSTSRGLLLGRAYPATLDIPCHRVKFESPSIHWCCGVQQLIVCTIVLEETESVIKRPIFLCCVGVLLATIQGSIEWLCLDHSSAVLTVGSFMTATALSFITGLHFGVGFAALYSLIPKQWLKMLVSHLRSSQPEEGATQALTGHWLALLITCSAGC